ncbi:unnamed protein product [Rhizophagus irregularis]|nr:unnamed protein product [Rhizophagus irregularis]CAB5356159.1 unnamed protein product [Rhizophagus irregularis]
MQFVTQQYFVYNDAELQIVALLRERVIICFTTYVVMSSESPKERAYNLGLCYLCQTCLHCNKNCSYEACKCKEEKKQKTPNQRGKKRKCYSQVYQPIGKKPFSSQQINELKRINNYYGYSTDFSKKVNFSLCSKCHPKFHRLSKKDKNTTLISILSENEDSIDLELLSSEIEEIEEIEVNFKLIIKAVDGKCNAAKWETIIAIDLQEFKNKLDRLIQEQFEDQIILRDEYNVAYKQEKEIEPGTQLTNKKDWEIFLKEYERIISNKRVLLILVKMKKNPNTKKTRSRDQEISIEKPDNKRNKKSASNQVPKEKNVNDIDAIIAQNIMELHSIWHCKEHERSCYIDSTRHISLTTNLLSTLARSIQHNLATLDDPPTLPLFDASNTTKKQNSNNNNTQNTQNAQSSNSFYSQAGYFPILVHPGMFNQQSNNYNFSNNLPQIQQTNISISPPTIGEFFENLEKTYECNFDEIKNKFLQEEIDVIDILSLKEYDWQNLGIKLGVKAKIMREVEKYRK